MYFDCIVCLTAYRSNRIPSIELWISDGDRADVLARQGRGSILDQSISNSKLPNFHDDLYSLYLLAKFITHSAKYIIVF